MIASLPMYDRAETAAANDHFWDLIRGELGHGPKNLTRDADPFETWLDPNLLLSQTCGYPYRARLHGKVSFVGTPEYGLPDCPAGCYYSVFVVRKSDPRSHLPDFAKARFAYNETMSQSGWAAPQNHAAGLGFTFTNTHMSGAHRNSAQMVADGRADIASLDAVSWDMMCEYDGIEGDLRLLARTDPTPALPYITALNGNVAGLAKAIGAAIPQLTTGQRACLRLHGLVNINAETYLSIPTPPGPLAGE